MVVVYALTSLVAAIATVLLLWPLGAIVAFAAAPFVASLAVTVVAVGVCAGESRRREATVQDTPMVNPDAA
jgi:hypothetical protein